MIPTDNLERLRVIRESGIQTIGMRNGSVTVEQGQFLALVFIAEQLHRIANSLELIIQQNTPEPK